MYILSGLGGVSIDGITCAHKVCPLITWINLVKYNRISHTVICSALKTCGTGTTSWPLIYLYEPVHWRSSACPTCVLTWVDIAKMHWNSTST